MQTDKTASTVAPAGAQRLVWGKNPVTELLQSGAAVDTVLLAETLAPPQAGYYTALAKQAGAVVKRVPAGKLQKLCGSAAHQGVAAWAAAVAYAELDDLLAAARQRGEPPFLVLCDGIEDPHNLGAVLRSAFLCGAHGAVIPAPAPQRGCRWHAYPTLPRPSARSKSKTFLSTAPTLAASPLNGAICPALSLWCWAARGAALVRWCASCVTVP